MANCCEDKGCELNTMRAGHGRVLWIVLADALDMLAAHLVCFFLLYCHRSGNLNMSSSWLCSRNDLMRIAPT
jgi:hypothetical protein